MGRPRSANRGSSQTWLLLTWLFTIFARKRSLHPFALFYAHLRVSHPTAFRMTAFGNFRQPKVCSRPQNQNGEVFDQTKCSRTFACRTYPEWQRSWRQERSRKACLSKQPHRNDLSVDTLQPPHSRGWG